MQTIKTAVVVVLLLVVLYGAYIAINGSETELPPELQNLIVNESDMNMPSFDSAGLTPGAGLKPGTPFAGSPSLSSNSALLSGPPPTFGAPTNEPAAAPPKTLTPPKLTSIPSFPNLGDSPAKLPSIPTSNSSTTDSLPEPTAEPSFSLNLDSPSKTDAQPNSNSGVQGTAPPVASLSLPKAPESAGSTSIQGKFASQTTPSTDSQPAPAENSLSAPSSTLPSGTEAAKKANITGRSFENAKQAAIEQVDRGEFKEALAKMSAFYNSPELTAEQNIDLINLLDSLAGETIYSRRHLLETPYVVGPGETIDDIAKRYEVPVELLTKINAVDTTIGLLPGTKLKVFRGPFRAEVDLNRHEMTVFLGDMYAGRFPVSTGSDPQPKEGVFQVLDKQRHRNYYGKGGVLIDGNDPRNPYGGWWMDLGQELSIHGSPDNPANDNASLGCISLSPLDAGDVFSMLSRTSQVTIKR